MLIAQISDTHIAREGSLVCGRVDTAECLRRAVVRLNALAPRPDLVVASGDLGDSDDPEGSYPHLRRLLAPLAIPVYLMAGNHDDRAALRRFFPDHAYLGEDGRHIHYAVEHLPLRLLCLDTQDTGHEHGLLDEGRLAWLEARLREAPARPTFVFMHHPPFDTGILDMDRIKCRGAEGLARILRGNPQVIRIACGHLHRTVTATFAGIPAVSAPSTAHQVELDLATTTKPVGFTLEPSGFLLHWWREDAGLVTHLVAADTYPGPYSFG